MKINFDKVIAFVILIFSLTGLVASFILTVETINVYKLGQHTLNCDLNSVINCSGVMRTPQAELLGFPNTLLGIAGYSMMFTTGVVMLSVKLGKRLMLLITAGAFGAFLFSYWLIYQSIFKIGFLCPYCLVSCVSATNVFFALILNNLKNNYFNLNQKINNSVQTILQKQYYVYFIGMWYLLMFGIIFIKYHEAFS